MKKIILVLEDEKPLLNAISKKLISKGFDVLQATSVKDAMNYLDDTNSHGIDAIWLDHYLLGGQSGLDLVFILKNSKSQLKDIPIFVVSNTATPDKIKAYFELKINSYYTKSDVKLEDVIKEINLSLEKKAKQKK